jgi:hypothetical protein
MQLGKLASHRINSLFFLASPQKPCGPGRAAKNSALASGDHHLPICMFSPRQMEIGHIPEDRNGELMSTLLCLPLFNFHSSSFLLLMQQE